MPIIPGLGVGGQENSKFKASLGYIGRSSQNKMKPSPSGWGYSSVRGLAEHAHPRLYSQHYPKKKKRERGGKTFLCNILNFLLKSFKTG
jgi:hypothetical protein